MIADFSNTRLEDWKGSGFTNVDQIGDQLRLMETHWAWLSRGLESFHWDIIRVTLPVELGPDAYPGWGEFRDAVAISIKQKIDISSYDMNSDGVIDTAWVIASSNGCSDCKFIIGGTSSNLGVTMFVDGQDSASVKGGKTGNFNHEVGHTIGIVDLYGEYGTLSYLTVMDDSWPIPPNDFTAYERALLGWVKPQVISRTKRGIAPPDRPSDAFATAASLAGSRVGWWQGAPSSRAPAWLGMAVAPVKAPESLAESQMRQLDNQVVLSRPSAGSGGAAVRAVAGLDSGNDRRAAA